MLCYKNTRKDKNDKIKFRKNKIRAGRPTKNRKTNEKNASKNHNRKTKNDTASKFGRD